MGGVLTVDSRTERWWFAADMCTGVNGLAGWHRSRDVYAEAERELAGETYTARLEEDRSKAIEGNANQPTPEFQAEVTGTLRQQYMDKILSDKGYRLSAPAETVARAYAGVAGLLNALCIFDVAVLSLMGLGAEPTGQKHRRRKGEREGQAK